MNTQTDLDSKLIIRDAFQQRSQELFEELYKVNSNYKKLLSLYEKQTLKLFKWECFYLENKYNLDKYYTIPKSLFDQKEEPENE